MSNETQDSIQNWANREFGDADSNSPRSALRLLEEALELCFACNASLLEIDEVIDNICINGKNKDRDIAKELGDVGVTLYRAAAVYGYDLHVWIDIVMTGNRTRKWQRHGDGTGQHIKED